MRISDWSSDVCSSDLRTDERPRGADLHERQVAGRSEAGVKASVKAATIELVEHIADIQLQIGLVAHSQWSKAKTRIQIDQRIGRRLERKSVVKGKSVSVGVDLGGRRHIKKKKK